MTITLEPTIAPGAVGFWTKDEYTKRFLAPAEWSTEANPTSAQIANVLDRVRNVLRKQGWAQGTTRREDGSRCLLGAIRFVLAGDDVHPVPHRYDKLHVGALMAICSLVRPWNQPNPERVFDAGPYQRSVLHTMLARDVWMWNDLYCRNARHVDKMLRTLVRALR